MEQQGPGSEVASHTHGRATFVLALTLILLPLLVTKYVPLLVADIANLDLLVPIGISFYTFRAISYVADVHSGKIEPERSLLKYFIYMAFFPEITSGPIERAGVFIPKLDELAGKKRSWFFSLDRIERGLITILWGCFLKMVIADRAAILVNTVYAGYWKYGAVEVALAAALYSVEILCDFAGYSAIAIGCGKILGFHLTENFAVPYAATSTRDFWRRWHISLSTWLRDYIYFPLGGSRCSQGRRYLNILVVFLVSGIWHGAGLTFVIWGGLHGLYQVIGIALRPYKDKLIEKYRIDTSVMSYRLLQVILTFALTTIAWIFFRAPSLHVALALIKRLLLMPDPWVIFDGSLTGLGLDATELIILVISVAILVLFDVAQERTDKTVDECLMSQNMWFRWTVLIALFLFVFVFGQYGPAFNASSFIYSEF